MSVNPPGTAEKTPPVSGKVIAALIVLALTVAGTISLGRWQLSRAAEKQQLLDQIEAGRRQPALPLRADVPDSALQPWRPVSARGRWLADRTVLLDNRTAGGRPGFWVVTPLQLEGPEPPMTVAVLRGWIPRRFPDQPFTVVPTPDGVVTVEGELVSHVPRLLELTVFGGARRAAMPPRLPMTSGELPRLQNLELDGYAAAADIRLLPALVQQTGGAGDGWVRDWPAPPSNLDMHRGYAMQWFSFAAIAAIAFGVLLVRHLRSTR